MPNRTGDDLNAGAKRLISIVVPLYNEESGVEQFYAGIVPVLESVPDINFEIVCVDDGSRDDTLSRLLQLVERDARITVVELSRNFGKEAALTAGIDAAGGDAVVLIDADLQDPPAVIPAMIREWQQGAEMVLARRIDRSSDSRPKRITAQLFYRLHNRIAHLNIPENVGDFRLIDRIAVDALSQLKERQRFMKGLFAWVGFKSATVEYTRQPREAGTTKFSGWKLWNFALEGITSFSTAPLKIWSYIGIVGAIATLSYAVFIIIRTIIHGIDVPGYASLLVAVLFFGSLQLITVGVLGEYIGRIYMETKQRPTYIVRRRYGETSGSKRLPANGGDRGAPLVVHRQTENP
jgi:polyisoprenyl-phosphate glycosyltransferase